MALQFVTKNFMKRPEHIMVSKDIRKKNEMVFQEEETTTLKSKNNKKKQKDDMIDKNQITAIEDAVKDLQPEVKVVKKDRGLIERTESSKIIITEDNRQVLND